MGKDVQCLFDALCTAEFRNLIPALLLSLECGEFLYELVDAQQLLERRYQRKLRIDWEEFYALACTRSDELRKLVSFTLDGEFEWIDQEELDLNMESAMSAGQINELADAIMRRMNLSNVRRSSGAQGRDKVEQEARVRIAEAVSRLRLRGQPINISSVATEANSNRRTVRKHIDLLSEV
jgi:hypothetical protein